MHINAWINTLL